MRKLLEHEKGQFVIIALLMVAIMIISIAALMHRAVTYYKHEPWEEYLTLIGNIELGSRRLVELSLSNYTNMDTPDPNVLRTNLEKWQTSLTRIYLGYGVALDYSLPNGTYTVYDTTVNYYLGLNSSWDRQTSISMANTTFTLGVTSIGLTGHRFVSTAFLNLTILNVSGDEINVTVKGEDGMPIAELAKENFQVRDLNITSLNSHYDQTEILVYRIRCDQTVPVPVTVEVWDHRGIYVRALF